MTKREQGIHAIVHLQKLAGIDEPLDRAAANWDGFSERDKDNTLAAHRVMCPDCRDADVCPAEERKS